MDFEYQSDPRRGPGLRGGTADRAIGPDAPARLRLRMGPGCEAGDLYEYTYALRAHAPEDRVEIVVLREGERVTLPAVLGRR